MGINGAQMKQARSDGHGHWTEEAMRAATGAGLSWRLATAWCQQGRTVWCAEFTHQGSGKTRHVRLCSAQFPSPTARRAEIVRQLQLGDDRSRP